MEVALIGNGGRERKAVWWKGPDFVLFMLIERFGGIFKKGVSFTETFSIKGQIVNISGFEGLLQSVTYSSVLGGFYL